MSTTLSDIRFLVEREVGSVEDPDILNWCNQVNMDVGTNIDIPATPQTIVLDVNTLSYALNADLKIINRLRLQSDITAGLDIAQKINYRIYNGQIIIPSVFWVAPDSLVVDYFKHMTYFSAMTDVIDIPDRFSPLYVFYCKLTYHNQQKPMQNVNWRVAINSINVLQSGYTNMKDQVVSYYSLGNEPVTIDSRWRG